MKVIVGLGNPGIQYATTRHNAGFRVVNRLATSQGWGWDGKRDRAVLAQGLVGTEKIVLVKPQTFMNESGVAVGPLVRFFKILPATDLLVICDDLDLPVGRVRVRAKGSAGGQHGLESVINHLGSPDFARLRVGIGRPPHPRAATIDHVLGTPHQDEAILLAEGEERAAVAALAWISEGTATVMNRYNADPRADPRADPKLSPGAKPSDVVRSGTRTAPPTEVGPQEAEPQASGGSSDPRQAGA